MAFIQKNNTGNLFLNDRKTETKHPDYTGKAIINNKPYWISAWIKVCKSGKKFISISIQEPFKQMKEKTVDAGCTNVEEIETYETTQETYDKGYGEPDLNQRVDEFLNQVGSKNVDEDVEVPF